MNYIIDLAFVALLLICILDGRRKGFVKIALSFAAMIITWFVASEFSMPVAEWAKEAFAGEWITKMIEGAIADSISNGTGALFESIPEHIAAAIESNGISLEELAAQLNGTVDPAVAAEKIYDTFKDNFVVAILSVISFFVLYLGMNLVLSVAIGGINKVFKLPFLKSFNRLFGAVFGGLKGAVVVAIVSIVFSLIAMLVPGSPFAQMLEQSKIHGIISEATHAIYGS